MNRLAQHTGLCAECSGLCLQLLHARLHCWLVAQQHMRVEWDALVLHAGEQPRDAHLPLCTNMLMTAAMTRASEAYLTTHAP